MPDSAQPQPAAPKPAAPQPDAPAPSRPCRDQSWRHRPKTLRLRDPMSGFLHFVAALLSVAALVLLIARATAQGTAWHVVSYAVFGAGMVLLYSASTLCHWFQDPDKPSRALERFDHAMIFVLIAATYTPICLVPLRGPWGFSLFGVVWGLAVLGIGLSLSRRMIPAWANAVVYIAMGWVFLVAVVPVVRSLPAPALTWMFIGGGAYTLGGVLFALRRPRLVKDVFSHHELFHILCMVGSFAFFWVMFAHVITLG